MKVRGDLDKLNLVMHRKITKKGPEDLSVTGVVSVLGSSNAQIRHQNSQSLVNGD